MDKHIKEDIKIDRPYKLLKIFQKELSKCFKANEKRIPIMTGIHKILIKRYARRFDEQLINKTIKNYCLSSRYLKCLVEGADRIDIKGNSVSKVTAKDEVYAKALLAKREKTQLKALNEQENQPSA